MSIINDENSGPNTENVMRERKERASRMILEQEEEEEERKPSNKLRVNEGK